MPGDMLRSKWAGVSSRPFPGRWAGLLLAGMLAGGALSAAVPTIEHFHPIAMQLGTTGVVSLVGKADPWPVKVWSDHPGLRFSATTNQGECRVTIDPAVGAGPHWVRVYRQDGASRPRCFVVDASPQTLEVEPNDRWAGAQAVASLPAAINGRLEKSGDIDSFAVSLAQGQTLVAAVQAYVLESPFDAVLRVVDARGVQQAWNHDAGTLDPFLAFTAPAAGGYVVQVMGFPYPATSEIRFHGSEKCVYRLQLWGGPYVRNTVPLGVGREGLAGTRRGRWRLEGWNFPSGTGVERELSVPDGSEEETFARVAIPGFEGEVKMPRGQGVESVEAEPNGRAAEANPIVVPGGVTGCLSAASDEDRFRFQARKGQRIQWTVQSAELGFPVDAWIKIENSNGVQVARSEGGNGRDPELSWSPGADGEFQIAIGSLVHRGGNNHWYRIGSRLLVPDFGASVAADSYTFRAGTTNEVKVTVRRLEGYTNRLTLAAEGWPESVVAGPVEVPAQGGEVAVKAVVATNAPAFQGSFRLRISAGPGDGRSASAVRFAKFAMVSASENNGVPGGYRDLLMPSVEALWLTVLPVEPAKSGEASVADKRSKK